MIEAGPLVRLHITLCRVPWRIAPAWAVLAGALAAGSPVSQPALALRVVAAVVLGDMVWGLLRRSEPTGGITSSSTQAPRVQLPYAEDGAPLSRAIRALTRNGMTWYGLLASIVFLLGGGLLIGLPALTLSVFALLIKSLSWSSAQRSTRRAVSVGLLDVLLPWLLGMFAVGWAYSDAASRWPPLVVAFSFTVLQASIVYAAASRRGLQPVIICLGILAVFSALVALHMPWAAAVVGVLMAPVAYWLKDAVHEGELASAFAERAGPWVLISLFVAALSLR